jgi:YbbR domain-containing protein
MVDILLRGRESVDRLSPDRVVAFADLTGLGVGEYSLTVQVTAPADAGVVGVTPQIVQVTIAAVRD